MFSKKKSKIVVFTIIIVQIIIIFFLLDISTYEIVEAETKDITEEFYQPLEVGNENRTTILTVGDSFTYGLGLNRSQSYPYILQKNLNENYPEKYKVEVAAFPGATIEDKENMIKKYDEEIDLVILQVQFLDFIDKQTFRQRQFKALEDAGYNNPGKKLPKAIRQEDEEAFKVIEEAKIEYIDKNSGKRKEVYKNKFEKIENHTSAEVWILDIITGPKQENKKKEIAQKFDWKYYDWEKFYDENYSQEEVVISETNHHFNEKGNTIWAEKMRDKIENAYY